ncbi:MAG: GTP pyrophosphokinase family protein [Clostridia bacterium]|jgi:putative GTP pyrophosphokinase|nr:GTP pyrophosphokinase family protein [Clostridia bacterium]
MKEKSLQQKISKVFNDKQLTEKLFLTKELMARYKCAILEVETKFRVLDEIFSIQNERNPIESIKTRLKSPESIIKKLMKKNLPMSPDAVERELSDVAGVRVICSFLDDIYMLSDCLINQDDVTLIEIKDYIKNPKENGYRSLHLIIEIPIFLHNETRNMKVEVQLRTITMESWADLEHKLRYKKDLSEELDSKISKELSECADLCNILDKKMLSVKNIVFKSSTDKKPS